MFLIVSGSDEPDRQANEATLKSEYDALDVPAMDTPGDKETVGSFQVEAGGLRSFIGTSRATAALVDAAISHSWLTVTEAIPSDWSYPTDG